LLDEDWTPFESSEGPGTWTSKPGDQMRIKVESLEKSREHLVSIPAFDSSQQYIDKNAMP